jgi:hypothetical protein
MKFRTLRRRAVSSHSGLENAGGTTVVRGTSMRTAVIALATIAVLASPMHAQAKGKGSKNSAPAQTEEQKKKAAEAEKAYKAAVDKIPNQKYDPWGSMR